MVEYPCSVPKVIDSLLSIPVVWWGGEGRGGGGGAGHGQQLRRIRSGRGTGGGRGKDRKWKQGCNQKRNIQP